MPKQQGVIAQWPTVGATPAGNPPAGNVFVYYKSTDGLLYTKTSAGVETAVGPVATMTQVEAEDSASVAARLTTGQRLFQAISKWAVTLAGTQTVTGAKAFSIPAAVAAVAGATPPTDAGDGAFWYDTANNPTYTIAATDITSGIIADARLPVARPLGALGYAQVTANQTGITAETDLTGLSVAVTVGTSRRLKITVQIQITAGSGSSVTTNIKEGTTVLNNGVANVVGGAIWTVTYSAIITPTAGAHTYKASLTGTTSTSLQAAATYPSFIIVEDIGV